MKHMPYITDFLIFTIHSKDYLLNQLSKYYNLNFFNNIIILLIFSKNRYYITK